MTILNISRITKKYLKRRLRNRGYNLMVFSPPSKCRTYTKDVPNHKAFATSPHRYRINHFDVILWLHHHQSLFINRFCYIPFRLTIIIILLFPNLQQSKLRNASQRTDRSRPLCDSRPIIVEITINRKTYVSVVRQSYNSNRRRSALDQ